MIKKILCLLLTVAVCISALPVGQVYGFDQPAPENLNISDASSGISDGQYRYSLYWENTSQDYTPDDDDAALGGSTAAQDVLVQRTNNSTPVQKSTVGYLANQFTGFIQNAVRGSLYSIKVSPWHSHITSSMVNGVEVFRTTPVYAQNLPEALYMTNLKVDAVGSIASDGSGNNALTVTWDNPMYYGSQVFPNYNIYYNTTTGTTNQSSVDLRNYQVITVPASSCELVTDSTDTSIKRLKYTISDASIRQGSLYNVVVEPCNENKAEIRNIQAPTVNVNGKITQIQFRKDKLYMATNVSVPFTLSLSVHSDNYLKLLWSQISSDIGIPGQQMVLVFSYSNDSKNWTELTRVYTTEVSYYLVNRPTTGITYYKLDVYAQESDISNTNVGALLTTTPPYPSFNASMYDIVPEIPSLSLDAKASGSSNYQITATWGAYIRPAFTEVEAAGLKDTSAYVDKNVYYTMWLSDDFNSLYSTEDPTIPSVITRQPFSPNATNQYNVTLSQYYSGKQSKMMPITSNRLYYARMIATKDASTPNNKGVEERVSAPSYALVFISATGQISTPPMVSKPPLEIAKDAEGMELVDDKKFTATWKNSWVEVYTGTDEFEEDSEFYDTWIADKIGVDEYGFIYFEDLHDLDEDVSIINLLEYNYLSDIIADYPQLEDNDDFIARVMNISGNSSPNDYSGTSYEFKVYPYDSVMLSVGTQEEYNLFLEDIIERESPGSWTQIPVSGTLGTQPTFTYNGSANTAYLVLFRAYRKDNNDNLLAAFPSYLIVSTLPPKGIVVVKPTVPVLSVVPESETDTSVTVKWNYSPLFDYTISYSDTYEDAVRGIITPAATVSVDSLVEFSKEDDATIVIYTVDGLFPETAYKIWVRAISKTDPSQVSEWSNYVSVKTKGMDIPTPPDGMGVASSTELKVLNDKLNASQSTEQYVPINANNIIISWLKNVKDKTDNTPGATADSKAERLEDASLTDTFLARFKTLIPNKNYYVRAKTFLTATMDTANKANKTYSYVIQVADNEDFVDPIQIIVPPTATTKSPKYFSQKESIWSPTLRIKTGTTKDEFDGEVDNDFYPLPTQSFEIIDKDDYVIYRFRSNSVDGDGRYDNNVDQRFISQLVINKVFDYKLNMNDDGFSGYQHIIELPYSIVSAMNERQIDFTVMLDDITATFPYSSLATPMNRSLGKSSTVKISISPSVEVSEPQSGVSTIADPFGIGVESVTGNNTSPLLYTSKNMSISLDVDFEADVGDGNVSMYYIDSSDKWQILPTVSDAENNIVTASYNQLGAYAVAEVGAAINGSIDDETDEAIIEFSKKIVITDSEYLYADGAITSSQFNSLVYAAATGKKEVAVNKSLSSAELRSLQRSGLAAPSGSTIDRQQAIALLMKLYETKTGTRITQHSTVDDTMYFDIFAADYEFQPAMLKAGDLGFYRDAEEADPFSSILVGDVVYILNAVLDDATQQ